MNPTIEKLAIEGGAPVCEKLLPYGRQLIEQVDIDAVVETLKSDWLTTGPKVGEFEKAFADYCGAKFAVAFSSGTAALHAAAHAAGIKEGDEGITTPLTFAATSNCILYCGGKPVFADIDPRTLNLDPQLAERAITSRTKAIFPVDFTGLPAAMDEFMALGKKHQLVIIEDAAHALGATYKGRRTGSIADMTIFSTHPVKHITTGEGGVVTTDNEEYFKKLKLFRSHGISSDARERMENGGWYYEMVELGYNYRITDIQCALGLSQLKKAESWVQRRRAIAAIYSKAFRTLPQIETPIDTDQCESAWHLYVIRLNLAQLKVGRKEFFAALRAENLGVNVHYIPVPHHPYYQKLGYTKGQWPHAESTYERCISLPLFPSMTDKDVQNVVHAVTKVSAAYAK
ncbi:MAG: UDP-4-amino-4,6-dideoxy-N-acetyl-beta-L-altrosamine transaminase [Verrucomicrobiota bacterium]|nr:UDP-4-amino-4,6-dideoxy-N-acetyl-beta-L-altrosamine transaminase [Verrucomicrobiota bacterium]